MKRVVLFIIALILFRLAHSGNVFPQLCKSNEIYTTCGTACPLTCDNYKNPPKYCTLQCVIGCQCKEGYVRNSDGKCCLPRDCNSKPKIIEPQEPSCNGPNEVFKRCGTLCPKTCATKDIMFKCKEGSQPGCFCADGYLRNSNNKCVLIKHCDI